MGLEQQAVGVIESLTNLAQEFGPYLFAILFIVFVPRIAHGYYTACATRTAPAPGKQELDVYRLYFVSSVGVGIVVMGLSISWWFYQHAKTKFIYQISINDLTSLERVASEYYYRDNPHQSILPGVAATHDALFLIVRNEPFSIGQTLSFQYVMQTPDAAPGGGGSNAPLGNALVPKVVAAKYTGGDILNFHVVSDASGPRLEAVAGDDRLAAVFTAKEQDAAARFYASAEKSR
jgi:hypothetical protein